MHWGRQIGRTGLSCFQGSRVAHTGQGPHQDLSPMGSCQGGGRQAGCSGAEQVLEGQGMFWQSPQKKIYFKSK